MLGPALPSEAALFLPCAFAGTQKDHHLLHNWLIFVLHNPRAAFPVSAPTLLSCEDPRLYSLTAHTCPGSCWEHGVGTFLCYTFTFAPLPDPLSSYVGPGPPNPGLPSPCLLLYTHSPLALPPSLPLGRIYFPCFCTLLSQWFIHACIFLTLWFHNFVFILLFCMYLYNPHSLQCAGCKFL